MYTHGNVFKRLITTSYTQQTLMMCMECGLMVMVKAMVMVMMAMVPVMEASVVMEAAKMIAMTEDSGYQ